MNADRTGIRSQDHKRTIKDDDSFKQNPEGRAMQTYENILRLKSRQVS